MRKIFKRAILLLIAISFVTACAHHPVHRNHPPKPGRPEPCNCH